MAFGKKLRAKIQFAKVHRWPQLAFNTIIVLLVIIILLLQPDLGDFWDESIGTISSIATFFIAIFLWFNDLSRDWKDSLGKRLFVDFNYKNLDGETKTAMKCEGAYLSGEADIRQWGQQIGKQMNENVILIFNALPESYPDADPRFDEQEKCFYKPYFLKIMLDSDEKGFPKLVDKIKSNVQKNRMLLWSRQNGMKDEWIELSSSPSPASS